jgi:hypothetical protein
MRRRSGNKDAAAPGEDSFLDVVANLVGILIILVMVVGAHAQDRWVKSAKQHAVESEELQAVESKASAAAQRVSRMQHENQELETRIKQEELATRMLAAERDAIQIAVLQLEQNIEKLELQKSSSQQQQLKTQNETARLQSELDKLNNRIEEVDVSNQGPTKEVETIQHRPSPIAKTVFGEELHFRLAAGRIAYVPMQELVGLVKLQLESKANSLKANQQQTSTVGPIDEFRMQYKMSATETTERIQESMVRRRSVQVDEFILLPSSNAVGTNVAAALQANSNFLKQIKRDDPSSITISLWVYPDSYQQFRQLKEYLTDRGYLVAAWPLPEGQPIAGSPSGYQSSAQ